MSFPDGLDDKIIQAAIDRGNEPPEKILEGMDALNVTDIFYWNAFHKLSTCRPVGMSVGPIPWTAVVQYAQIYGVDHSQLWYIIHSMDCVYLRETAPNKDK